MVQHRFLVEQLVDLIFYIRVAMCPPTRREQTHRHVAYMTTTPGERTPT
jgi:hypothetical protein